jgi:D-serine deaminase-like pyridoxal phosphate-dependent protein
MTSPSTPASRHSITTRLALAIGGGGAGWLGTLAFTHQPSTTALAAAAAGAVLIINAVSSAGRALPGIIRALSDRKTARIKATADAETQVMRAQARIKLAQDGIDPDKFPQAAELIRLLSIDPDMPPDGHRLNDDALARLLTATRPRSTSTKPGNRPRRPGGSPRKPGSGDESNVLPLRPDR